MKSTRSIPSRSRPDRLEHPPVELVSIGAMPFDVLAHDETLQVRCDRGDLVLRGEQGLAIWREHDARPSYVKGPCEMRVSGGGSALEIRVARGAVWGPEAALGVDLVDVRAVTPLSLVLVPGAREEIARRAHARRAH
jgi:hypothetical protein